MAAPRRSTRGSVRALGRSTPPSPSSPFVGRGHELALLCDALPSRRGVGIQVRFVTGEPGIGKTRLADELAGVARAEGHRVAWAQVWRADSAPPYWPWTQVVRQLRGDQSSIDLAALVRPEVEVTDRFELFDATATVLREAAERSPLVVVLDDLHDVDPPSLLLLHFLAAHLRDSPLLVLGTYRDVEVAQRPELAEPLAGMERLAVEVPLRGLDPREVGVLADDRDAGQQLHAVTGGNPLLLEQVLREGAGDGGSAGPEALRAALERRLGHQPPEVRQLLAALAVLGPGSQGDALAAVAGCSPAEVASWVRKARQAGLLEVGTAWFAHPLIAEVALTDTSEELRRGLHERAADHLLSRPSSAAERARHLVEASPDRWREAVAALLDAAAHAHRAFAYEDAVSHLERARALVEGHDEDDRLTFEVVLALAGAELAARGRAASAPTYQRAWVLAERIGDPLLVARAAARHSIQFFFSGDVAADQADHVRTALAVLPDGAEDLRALLHAHLSVALVVGDPAEARAQAETALAIARRGADPRTIATALVAQQVSDLGPSTLLRRLGTARQIVALAEQAGDQDLAVHGRFLLMAALLERGDMGELDALLSAQHDAIDTVASPRFARHALWFQVMRAMLDGDPTRVVSLAEACYAIAERLEDPDGAAVFWGQVGVAQWMQGRLLEMEPAYLEQRRAEPGAPLWSAVLAWVWADHGQLDAARGALEQVPPPEMITPGQHTLLTLVTAGEAAIAVGDDARVAQHWEALLPYADHVVPIGMGAAAWGTVARPLGRMALHLGHVDEGLAHLERAIAVCARLGARPWLVEAQLALAAALLDHGRGDDPRVPDLVAEAAATAQRLALAVFDARTAVLATRLDGASRGLGRLDPSSPPDTPSGRPRVSVLGTFEVTAVDGSTPRWTSRKARELLKILVARRGQPVAREVLMDLLWPGEEPGELGNRLSVAVSTVRRALDPGRSLPAGALVANESGALRLTRRVETDVVAFLSAAETALAAYRSASPEAPSLLRAAAAAHGGVALPDEPYASWAEALRTEVTAALATVLRARADVAVRGGDHLGASEAHRGLLALDPYDEGAHRGLIEALRAMGAHGQADAAADRYRQAMADLGIDVPPVR